MTGFAIHGEYFSVLVLLAFGEGLWGAFTRWQHLQAASTHLDIEYT